MKIYYMRDNHTFRRAGLGGMMEEERKVSGCIYAKPDKYTRDGVAYVIRPSSQGWGLPTENLEPDDLRKLADELEKIRST